MAPVWFTEMAEDLGIKNHKQDPRYIRLKKSLEQLSTDQLKRGLSYPEEICWNTWNYNEGNQTY